MTREENAIIQVAFGLYDKDGNYAKYTATVIASIFANTKHTVIIHVLHDATLNEYNREQLIKLGKKYSQQIVFHFISLPPNLLELKGVKIHSPGTMFRLCMPDIFKDLRKIIYLDSDILVNMDIYNLWKRDITNYAIAAVKDANLGWRDPKIPIDNNSYFNSGVMVFNLDKIHKDYKMFDQCIAFTSMYPNNNSGDQNALNYVFQNDCLFLDEKFNFMMRPGLESKVDYNVIYHFVNPICKPWKTRYFKASEIWFRYYNEIPWVTNIDEFMIAYNAAESLDSNLLTAPIYSRRKFLRNFFLRLFLEIRKKYFSKFV